MATAQLEIKANTDRLIAQCRIIAKHLTALADELELTAHDGDEVEREP